MNILSNDQIDLAEQINKFGLADIAADLGQPVPSHTDCILAKLLTTMPDMEKIKSRVRKLAPAELPVLILGETGTGKELIAQALHGGRKPETFIPINCGAIPPDLLESELFGAKKGAFTGAICDRSGLLEQANGGTLFLDEIGDMPLYLQCKLLRVINDKKFRRVGDPVLRETSFRVVSATNHIDLADKNSFRSDLYYRLAGDVIILPPLRERPIHDVSLIAAKFAKTQDIAERVVSYVESLETSKRLRGNVRELLHLIEKYNINLG